MTTVNLYWFRHPDGSGNFGDEIGPWLIRKFSPSTRIQWYDPLLAERPTWVKVAATTRSVLRRDPRYVRVAQARSLSQTPTLLTVGSIIRRARSEHTTVWGSGAISEHDIVTAGDFRAVRGHVTRELLQARGITPPEVVGDPGLLVPLLLQVNRTPEFVVGVVPHFQHYDSLREVIPQGALAIDLTWDLPRVMSALASCELVVSTSLHGLILAHALGIPAVWGSFDESQGRTLAGDGIKYRDYFSSVDIQLANPTSLGPLAALDSLALQRSAKASDGLTCPHPHKVKALQRNLLLAAPPPLSGSTLRQSLLRDLL